MIHLIIAKGGRQGEEVAIPETGMRVGRAPANDLVIDDAALSQFHCRFFFKSDHSLWVTDFGSTNQTLVNGVPVVEERLNKGDLVDVGGAVLRVVNDTLGRVDSRKPAVREKTAPGAGVGEGAEEQAQQVDLGFGPQARKPQGPLGKTWLIRLGWTIGLILLVLVGMWVVMHYAGDDAPARERQQINEVARLAIYFEKIEGSPDNIFRYAAHLEDNRLKVEIDDIKNSRHVSREKELNPELVARLERDIRETDFMQLDPEYTGVSENVHNLLDLTVVTDDAAHRVRVLNRVEPDTFKQVREKIEEYVQTEMGLAAMALSPERLLELASQAYLEGRTRYEQRDVRYGNLADSVRNFMLAEWYLETIEPKPNFYADVVSGLDRSRRELEERYKDYLFRADRATRLSDWREAAQNLRIILRLIPDRNDERHQKAERELLRVERYLR